MLLWILLLWLLIDVLATYSVLHHRRAFLPVPALQGAPEVAILVAIKGVGSHTPRFLQALASQQYPDFRLVFALESESDAAFALLSRMQRELEASLPIDIVIAGLSTARAQKVQNLLAALERLRPEDRIVVLADADILPDPSWLERLVRPVAIGDTAASTGYRWQLPQDRRWSSLTLAAIDMSIATCARSRRWNLCWGGSIALDRAVLDRLNLPRVWDRAASDDLTLTAALRAAGARIYVPPWVLVPTPVSHSWMTFFAFARRQYVLVRTYAFRHWLLVGAMLSLPALATLMALWALPSGQRWPLAFIAASLVLLQLRLSFR
jgi:ceramide glucosyltransferase